MDTEYLMQHPTSMPLPEAAMAYLFLYAPPILRVVPPVVGPGAELDDGQLIACGA